jgi:hypothetical protein
MQRPAFLLLWTRSTWKRIPFALSLFIYNPELSTPSIRPPKRSAGRGKGAEFSLLQPRPLARFFVSAFLPVFPIVPTIGK